MGLFNAAATVVIELSNLVTLIELFAAVLRARSLQKRLGGR